MLKVVSLAASHDGDLLFSGLDLGIGDGDRIGVVGPNGAGKTTLLRLLAGELRPAGGSVTVGPGARVEVNLHPPLLRAMGLKRKLRFGPWFDPALRSLYRMRRLRGTSADPFGRAEVRKVERALIVANLELTQGNREKAARILGMGERTLYRKLKEYGLT